MESLFTFRNYKAFLMAAESTKAYFHKGFRTRIAEAAQCNTSFVTHVISGPAHFSLEQAQGIVDLLQLAADEAHFFMLLVQHDRAGTEKLRDYFAHQLEALVNEKLSLKHRFEVQESLTPEEKSRYYSSWEYGAVHMLVTIPDLATAPKIAKRLDLSFSRVQLVLEHLEKMRLIDRRGKAYVITNKRLHLTQDSPLIALHHSHWRLKCLSHLSQTQESDFHYSSAITISREDSLRFRELIKGFLTDLTPKIGASKEECLYSFCVDFYEI